MTKKLREAKAKEKFQVVEVELPGEKHKNRQIRRAWMDLLVDSVLKVFGPELIVASWTVGERRIVLRAGESYSSEEAADAGGRFMRLLRKIGRPASPEGLKIFLDGNEIAAPEKPEPEAEPVQQIGVALNMGGSLLGYLGIYTSEDKAVPQDISGRDLLAEPTEIVQALRFLWELVTSERDRLDAIVNGIIDGVLLLNEEGDILFANRTAYRVLGLEKRSCFSVQNLSQAKNLDISPLLLEARENRMNVLNRIQKVEKLKSIFGVHIQRLRGRRGSELGWMVILRDITADWEMDRLRKEFIAKITHELHSPLTVISEGIALVLEEKTGGINEDQKRCLSYAKQNVKRMERLIDNLLRITRLELRDAELERRRSVDLRMLARQMAESYSPLMQAKQIRFVQQLPDQDLRVQADRDRLTQVFANLLDNALKYTPVQGLIELGCKSEGSKVFCWVRDTGPGVPEEEQEKIFQKFYRVKNAENQEKRGHGLGLAIAREIVQSYGGKIWVESQPGEGSTFLFYLPLIDPEVR
ncbi:MAG TPA: GHKL domain-containing protein [Bacteroidetes bacterium]|nr:GHKL domain-containing protein [Bacteroidota bacterium]